MTDRTPKELAALLKNPGAIEFPTRLEIIRALEAQPASGYRAGLEAAVRLYEELWRNGEAGHFAERCRALSERTVETEK